ncbi:MAG: trypsin-like peptidase domain-containing protein [Halothiobacillus sp.]
MIPRFSSCNLLGRSRQLLIPPHRSALLSVLLAAVLTVNLTACGEQKSTTQVTGLPDFSALVAANNDSVVNITAIAPLSALPDSIAPEKSPSKEDQLNQFFHQFFGFNGSAPDAGNSDDSTQGSSQPPEPPDTNSGSGFILSRDGYILTNQHVIDGSTQVFVRLADGRELKAQVKGSDKAGDIALLKIDADHLEPVKIGNSDLVKPGQWAVAIGSPFGFDHSVTAGIISAKGRALPGDADQRYVPFLQTDVAINPGSSGGPLFNIQGQVIGINAQILTESGGYNGLSFSIPINYAMQVADQLKKGGVVERGFLGVQIQSLDRAMASAMGLDRPQGALITGFIAGSPAEQSDLQPGDIIVAANGHAITESSDLPQTIGVLPPGTEVKLTVLTQGKSHRVDVKLGVLPQRAPTQIQSMKSHDLIVDNFGLLLTDDAGMIRVKAVEPEGPAAAAGLAAQDILLSLNRHPLDSLDAAETAFQSAKKDAPNAVLIRRGSSQHFLALSLQPD